MPFPTSISFLISSHTFRSDEIISYGFRLWQSEMFSTGAFQRRWPVYLNMTHPFKGPGAIKQAKVIAAEDRIHHISTTSRENKQEMKKKRVQFTLYHKRKHACL